MRISLRLASETPEVPSLREIDRLEGESHMIPAPPSKRSAEREHRLHEREQRGTNDEVVNCRISARRMKGGQEEAPSKAVAPTRLANQEAAKMPKPEEHKKQARGLEKLARLATDRKMEQATDDLFDDRDNARQKAKQDPEGFLRSKGVDIPEGAEVTYQEQE